MFYQFESLCRSLMETSSGILKVMLIQCLILMSRYQQVSGSYTFNTISLTGKRKERFKIERGHQVFALERAQVFRLGAFPEKQIPQMLAPGSVNFKVLVLFNDAEFVGHKNIHLAINMKP